MCATQALSFVVTFVVQRHRRPSRQREDFSKAPLFVRFCECSSLFVGSHGICEEM